MRILAIETSCDETAVSILECSGDLSLPRFEVLGTGLYSQAHKHAEYGGVYPNLAKREHEQNLIPMLKIALEESGLSTKHQAPSIKEISNIKTVQEILKKEERLFGDVEKYLEAHPSSPGVDAIAVTQGPGLEPALWVGLNFAKALSAFWGLPLIPTNHMEGHVLSVLMNEGKSSPLQFPAVALLISGGHTELIHVRDWLSYERIGETRDDAIGEAFDKVARLLGLPYPGGPEISRLAAEARREPAPAEAIKLPRPMINTDDYDFSFSGLKTAVLYAVRERGTLTDAFKRELAREFEDAATDVLCAKTKRALEQFNAKSLIVGGGVIANTYIRSALEQAAHEVASNITTHLPTSDLSTDNAVMIGVAGYLNYIQKPDLYPVYDIQKTLHADGTLKIETR